MSTSPYDNDPTFRRLRAWWRQHHADGPFNINAIDDLDPYGIDDPIDRDREDAVRDQMHYEKRAGEDA